MGDNSTGYRTGSNSLNTFFLALIAFNENKRVPVKITPKISEKTRARFQNEHEYVVTTLVQFYSRGGGRDLM